MVLQGARIAQHSDGQGLILDMVIRFFSSSGHITLGGPRADLEGFTRKKSLSLGELEP
jgi:hypothetical protein